jgi:hypothetical protein
MRKIFVESLKTGWAQGEVGYEMENREEKPQHSVFAGLKWDLTAVTSRIATLFERITFEYQKFQ